MLDLSGSFRPLWSAESGRLRFNAELQIAGQYGDSVERGGDFSLVATDSTARDLFDLSRNWSRGESHRLDARIDRLAASWTESWGTVTAGRHAVTWGGGLIFNPFDLFNPFAPADIVRDFKIGADMVHVDLPLSSGGFQALAVGRRSPLNGTVSSSASSLAVQWQHRFGNNELFLLAGQHYDEPVFGAGLSGLFGAATWRIDATWQQVQAEGTSLVDNAFSAVANMQYSWVWGGKNVYGFLEYYYNGWGEADVGEALFDPHLVTQLARANAFVLGRHYAAASAQVELHPLLSLFVSSIVNLEDSSLLLQPRLNWNASAQLQLTLGLDIPIGERGTEFGGVELVPTGRTTRAPTSAYGIATWDF